MSNAAYIEYLNTIVAANSAQIAVNDVKIEADSSVARTLRDESAKRTESEDKLRGANIQLSASNALLAQLIALLSAPKS